MRFMRDGLNSNKRTAEQILILRFVYFASLEKANKSAWYSIQKQLRSRPLGKSPQFPKKI